MITKFNFPSEELFMKKLLLATALFAMSTSVAFAFCPNNPQKIVNKIKSHNVTAINVTYSSDMTTWAQDIKKGIIGLDSNLTVNLVPASGAGICKITKA